MDENEKSAQRELQQMREKFKEGYIANKVKLRQVLTKNKQLIEDEKQREEEQRIKEKWRQRRKKEEEKGKMRLQRYML